VTARELAQTLNVSYRTARRMLGIIRGELATPDHQAERIGYDHLAESTRTSERSGRDRDLLALIVDESRAPEPSWTQRATGPSAVSSEPQGGPYRFASVRDATRERILAATCRAVVEKGMAAVRVSDIARDAGLSTATVHYYFETRDDVLFAAAKWHNLRETLRRAAIVESDLSPVAKLLVFLEASMPPNGFGRDEALIRYDLWGRAMRDARYREILQPLREEWRSQVVAILNEGVLSGDFRTEVSFDLEVEEFLAVLDSYSFQYLIGYEWMTAERMWALLTDFTRRHLGIPDSRMRQARASLEDTDS
jgi:AcrR family transcriptional regulator